MDEHGRQRSVGDLRQSMFNDLRRARPDWNDDVVSHLADLLTRSGTVFAELVSDRETLARESASRVGQISDMRAERDAAQDKADMYESDRDRLQQALEQALESMEGDGAVFRARKIVRAALEADL